MTIAGDVRLGELYADKTGSVNPQNHPNEVFDLFSVPSYESGKPDIVVGAEIGSSKINVEPGDVLICRIVPHIRRAWVVPPVDKNRQIASGEWIVLRDSRIHPQYLRQLLLSDVFHRQFMSTVAGVGGSLLRARPAQAASIPIPLPPLPEQRRIAEILDRAEELRAKRRRALTLLEELADSIFQNSFPGGEMLESSVEELLADSPNAIRTGPFGSQLLHSEFVSEGVAVLGIDSAVSNAFKGDTPRFITRAKYEQLKRYTVRPGDVLITIMGTVGRCAVVPQDIPLSINTKHLCCITLNPEKCLPEYLHEYFLRHPSALKYLKSVSKGAIMDGLNMGLIRSMPVALPSMAAQSTFRERLEILSQTRRRVQVHLAELDELFASLQHRAFSGQL